MIPNLFSGSKAVYRNKIDHVAKFFEDKYSDPSHIDYMIYNLCSEMEYDHRKFHGNVRRFQIDDHNVPRLDEMVKLVEDVRAWLRGGEDGRQRYIIGTQNDNLTLKPNYTLLQLGLWLFIVREGREEQEQ